MNVSTVCAVVVVGVRDGASTRLTPTDDRAAEAVLPVDRALSDTLPAFRTAFAPTKARVEPRTSASAVMSRTPTRPMPTLKLSTVARAVDSARNASAPPVTPTSAPSARYDEVS